MTTPTVSLGPKVADIRNNDVKIHINLYLLKTLGPVQRDATLLDQRHATMLKHVKVPMKRNFLRQFSYCIGKIS